MQVLQELMIAYSLLTSAAAHVMVAWRIVKGRQSTTDQTDGAK